MSGAVVAAPMVVLVFRGLAVLVLVGIAVQFFLAGSAVFGHVRGWDLHAMTGGVLGLPVLGLLLMSLSRGLRAYRGIAGLLLAVYLTQFALVGLGRTIPMLGGLHPLNGLLMGLIAAKLMGRLLRSN